MRRSSWKSTEGSILIQVALGLLALMAMSTFVFDWGVMWVARRQAQNAADAGALAGAVSMAFDADSFSSDSLKARQSAIGIAQVNYVWGEAPTAGEETDDPANTVNAYTLKCPDIEEDTCIRVDVYRNVAKGNPMPMFFGQLMGLTEQGVQATATARAASSDWVEHIRPWAIPDLWIKMPEGERVGFGDDGEFSTAGPNPDIYRPPSDDEPTGFTLASDYGRCVTIDPQDPHDTIAPGNYFQIALDGKGGKTYEDNIKYGSDEPLQIGSMATMEPGRKTGPTKKGMDYLIGLDSGAHWVGSGASGHVEGSAFATSPRIVPIAIFDPAEFEVAKQNGRGEVHVVNILGFFVDQVSKGEAVTGCLVTIPGTKYGLGEPAVNPLTAFLKTPLLVR